MGRQRLDLRSLAVDRAEPAGRWPGPGILGWALPAALSSGFAALVLAAGWDRLFPPRPVTVVPTLATAEPMRPAVDAPVFQAAGWVEPRPTATLVTAPAEGVVERLLVVEGQAVQAGEVLATLATADAELGLASAEAEAALRRGELSAAQSTHAAAVARLEQPLHLQVELADAELVNDNWGGAAG